MTAPRRLSVVIPTRDRADALPHTLDRLLGQRPPGGGFEVIVVDNGSTDETPRILDERAAREDGRLRHLTESRPGPAAARNAGVAAAAGDLVLFLGDDTAPASDDLLRRHAELHGRRSDPHYAVLGRVTWTERSPVTPLMRWLETRMQFAYGSLSPGPVSAAEYLYTSHVSLKRSALEAVGGFDTRFPYAAVEDMEIGMRLAARGLELDYRPELLVLHSHPTTLDRSLGRMVSVGRSSALLEQLHPDEKHPNLARARGPVWAAVRATSPLVARLEPSLGYGRARRLAWRILHLAAYARGFRRGPPE